jgi:RND family efflux transporter MFP subunit
MIDLLRVWLIISITMTAVGCKKPTENKAPASEGPKKPVVLVEKISRADLVQNLVYPVDVEAEVKVSINPLVSERILKFPWKNGDFIKKRQVVAKVRADNAAQALAQMQAELESLDAQIDNQKNELARADQLLEKKVITGQAYDQIKSSVRVSEAKRKSVEAAISQTRIAAGHAVIRAPISGIIANKRVNQGDLAAPQIPLCDIMTEDPVKVVLKLTERDVTYVSLDQAVVIELDAYPNRTFTGRISKILPYMDPATRTNEVEVLLPNPVHPTTNHRLLKPGMFGRARIVAKESQNTIAAPERALLIGDSTNPSEMIAFIVDEEGIARKRTVKTGIRDGELVEILSGLEEKERVVVRGQYGLKDGEPVTLFHRSPKTADKTKDGK